MKSYILTVEYVDPKNPFTNSYTKKFGPLSGKQIVNKAILLLIKKRNVVNVEIREVKDEVSN